MRFRLFGKSTKIALGGAVIIAAILIAIFAPYLAPYDPYQQNLIHRLKPPSWSAGGTSAYLLGTDTYGRDLLSRLIYGSRLSILVGVSSMAFSCLIGSTAGVVAGLKGGRIEQAIMRHRHLFGQKIHLRLSQLMTDLVHVRFAVLHHQVNNGLCHFWIVGLCLDAQYAAIAVILDVDTGQPVLIEPFDRRVPEPHARDRIPTPPDRARSSRA